MSMDAFLAHQADTDLLRFSTAGSVDDGKSTLIGRLLYDSKSVCTDTLASVEAASRRLNRQEADLAMLTDGLRAEREQGITIDVAYRYFATPRRRFIIADTPGHEQYTRNMVTGASTADLIVILVDASVGLTTQSKRHAFLAALMAIPHVVIAINKMDLLDYAQAPYDALCRQFADFAAKLSIGELTFIPLSALRGDNIVHRSARMAWYEGPPLLAHLESVSIAANRNLIDFRFPVQLVNRPNAEFRGVCGTVASGVVRPGDEVIVLPSGRRTRVASIVTFDGPLQYAFAPQAVTLTLADEVDVSRGDLLAHPANQPTVCRSAEAMLVWMNDTPLQTKHPYLLKHAASLVRASVVKLHYGIDPNTLHRQPTAGLRLNEIGRAELEFFQPLACDTYRQNRVIGAFVLIDPDTNLTVACGMILRCGAAATPAAPPAPTIRRETSLVSRRDRERAFGQRAVTLWLTGLSGAGKTTIARQVEKRLCAAGHPAALLDGDNLRHGLNQGLGFSPADRSENIRRAAEAARLLNDAGLIALVALISPMQADRQNARVIIGAESFLEIHVACPLAVCEQRDVKDLYKRARAGEIPQFTGITAPYEPPPAPDLTLPTDALTLEQSVDTVLQLLADRRFLQAPPQD